MKRIIFTIAILLLHFKGSTQQNASSVTFMSDQFDSSPTSASYQSVAFKSFPDVQGGYSGDIIYTLNKDSISLLVVDKMNEMINRAINLPPYSQRYRYSDNRYIGQSISFKTDLSYRTLLVIATKYQTVMKSKIKRFLFFNTKKITSSVLDTIGYFTFTLSFSLAKMNINRASFAAFTCRDLTKKDMEDNSTAVIPVGDSCPAVNLPLDEKLTVNMPIVQEKDLLRISSTKDGELIMYTKTIFTPQMVAAYNTANGIHYDTNGHATF